MRNKIKLERGMGKRNKEGKSEIGREQATLQQQLASTSAHLQARAFLNLKIDK
jgi:hypothetical protein